MNEVPSCTCSCAQSEISAHEPNSQSIQELEHKLSRRNALVAGATATAGALALSACAEGSSGGGGGGGNGAAGPESPTDIAAASEVPVGKAAKLTKGGVTVIVSQPEDGVLHPPRMPTQRTKQQPNCVPMPRFSVCARRWLSQRRTGRVTVKIL